MEAGLECGEAEAPTGPFPRLPGPTREGAATAGAALAEASSGGRLDPPTPTPGGRGARGFPLWEDGLEPETASHDFIAGGLRRRDRDNLGRFFSRDVLCPRALKSIASKVRKGLGSKSAKR